MSEVTECSSIEAVRENIDRIDRQIVALLAERGGYEKQDLCMEIRNANQSDLAAVMNLVRSCVIHMESQGIRQWDEIYPDEATLRNDIERRELFALEKDHRISGIVVLNDHQEPQYQEVTWEYPGKALVVHRLAIDPSCQGRGCARKLMQFAYEFAKERQYSTIRLDAFARNPRAVALYERLGYRTAGTVVFRKGPFFCFEIRVA